MATFTLKPERPDAVNLMIGIPTYGDVLYDRLAILLLQLGLHLQKTGAGFKLVCIGRTRVEKSRNMIASLFHSDSSFTHLLFIDSDMYFDAELVLQMLKFDKDFIGVASPSRKVVWDKVHRAAQRAEDPAELSRLGHHFIHQLNHPNAPAKQQEITIDQGFVQAHAVGGGVLLLKRPVFARMTEAYPDLKEPVDSEERKRGLTEYWGFFNTLRPGGSDTKIMAEDYAFCFRWREGCGGEVWCNVSQPITHYGANPMTGRLQDQLEKGWLG
ncbi:MAG: hypothetical protein AAF557_20845 [Pseudomonadota bacterium]